MRRAAKQIAKIIDVARSCGHEMFPPFIVLVVGTRNAPVVAFLFDDFTFKVHPEQKQRVVPPWVEIVVTYRLEISPDYISIIDKCRKQKQIAAQFIGPQIPSGIASVLKGVDRNIVLITLHNGKVVIQFIKAQNGIRRWVLVVHEMIEVGGIVVRIVSHQSVKRALVFE